MDKPTIRTIPENVKLDLIALAVLQSGLRKTRDAMKVYRKRINAEMRGASRLAANGALMVKLIHEHNARSAKYAAR